MDVNNNLANVTLKVKCDLCEKSFFVEFLSKHMRVSHPGVERPVKKKTQNLIDKNDLKFFCKFCIKGFAVKREMKRHKKRFIYQAEILKLLRNSFGRNLSQLKMVVCIVVIVTKHFLATKVPDLITCSGIWLKMLATYSFVNFVMKNLQQNMF